MNLALSATGIAVQADKDTAAIQPTYWHGVAGGELVTASVTQEEDPITTGLAAGTGEFRSAVGIAADYEARAWLGSIGAYLYAILGDKDVTGTGDPYTHTIEAGSTIPYLTVFGQRDTDYLKATACKLDRLVIEWDGNGPLKVTPSFMGLGFTYGSAAYTPTTDETLTDYLLGLQGAYTLDLDGAGEDCDAVVQGGSLTFSRNLKADPASGSLAPADVSEGILTVEASVTVRVPDLTVLRMMLTGTTSGTTASEDVLYGELSTVFTDGTHSLTIAANKWAWKPTNPSVGPDEGPAIVTLSGKCYIASGETTPVTVTLVNAVASY